MTSAPDRTSGGPRTCCGLVSHRGGPPESGVWAVPCIRLGGERCIGRDPGRGVGRPGWGPVGSTWNSNTLSTAAPRPRIQMPHSRARRLSLFSWQSDKGSSHRVTRNSLRTPPLHGGHGRGHHPSTTHCCGTFCQSNSSAPRVCPSILCEIPVFLPCLHVEVWSRPSPTSPHPPPHGGVPRGDQTRYKQVWDHCSPSKSRRPDYVGSRESSPNHALNEFTTDVVTPPPPLDPPLGPPPPQTIFDRVNPQNDLG